MKKLFRKENMRYYAVALLFSALSNRAVFFIGHLFARGARIRDFSLPGEPLLPFLPWTIWIYLGIIPWCAIVYYLVSQRERREADRFFAALILSRLICLLFFILFPTHIERPELSGNSLSMLLLKLLYLFDTPDDLFPSAHCLLAWLCWVGVRGKKDLLLALRVGALLLAAAVCVSTLTVRQHVLADIFAGILLAELCWQLAKPEAPRALYASLSARLERLLFRAGEGED